jgi:hypothetical protein
VTGSLFSTPSASGALASVGWLEIRSRVGRRISYHVYTSGIIGSTMVDHGRGTTPAVDAVVAGRLFVPDAGRGSGRGTPWVLDTITTAMIFILRPARPAADGDRRFAGWPAQNVQLILLVGQRRMPVWPRE